MGGLPEEIRPCQREIQAKQTPLSEGDTNRLSSS
jgi:hypothetical protein